MIITRHNYEEFFLMYVDDELAAEERVAVDLFIKQNPDLAPELSMLLQTKLSMDESLHFEDKKILLQNVEEIGIDNYEEQFLLYIDNELEAKKRNDVEKFVLQHPQFQDEFTLLKQTVLEQEKIVFEDKESLLKREERRVVPMFIRLAAAAAVIGIAVMTWFMWNNNSSTPGTIAGVNGTDSVKNNTASVTKDNPETINKKDNNVSQDVVNPLIEQKKEETASVQQKVEKKNKEEVLPKNIQTNNTQKDEVAVNTTKKDDNSKVSAIAQPTHDEELPMTTDVAVNGTSSDAQVQHDNTAGNRNDYLVQNVAYKELNTAEEDNKSALYLGSLQINKNKVRGLVKKVGGLFAGRSKDAAKEDGKLQIANLEINTN